MEDFVTSHDVVEDLDPIQNTLAREGLVKWAHLKVERKHDKDDDQTDISEERYSNLKGEEMPSETLKPWSAFCENKLKQSLLNDRSWHYTTKPKQKEIHETMLSFYFADIFPSNSYNIWCISCFKKEPRQSCNYDLSPSALEGKKKKRTRFLSSLSFKQISNIFSLLRDPGLHFKRICCKWLFSSINNPRRADAPGPTSESSHSDRAALLELKRRASSGGGKWVILLFQFTFCSFFF